MDSNPFLQKKEEFFVSTRDQQLCFTKRLRFHSLRDFQRGLSCFSMVIIISYEAIILPFEGFSIKKSSSLSIFPQENGM